MDSLTIPKHINTKDDQDYQFLKQVGLQHIEAMSSQIWTDYNTHDPGITLMEVLCYAITDLGYRIEMPIPDLLTNNDNAKSIEDVFPTAKQIFTTKPITETDYRKLFIDIDGVKNAFISPYRESVVHMHCSNKDEVSDDDPKGTLSYSKNLLPHYEYKNSFILKGLNQVLFELDTQYQQMDIDDPERIAKLQEIVAAITEKYHGNRNLCEDLHRVEEVGEFEFQVCGDIEIEKTANANDTVVEILFRIQEHVAPSIRRKSLEQLLEEGKTTDAIFNGPILENGFITNEELERANFQTEVRLSDIIQIISETPGVAGIKDISMMSCPCNDDHDDDCIPDETQWKICFPTDFDKVIKLCLNNSIINVFKDVIPITINQENVKDSLLQKFEEYNKSIQLTYDDITIPQGQNRNSGAYYTIQNDLPELYGIGEVGLSKNVSEERKAQAKQLKGYLTFFDQILATYFTHLQQIGKLLSADVNSKHSYFVEKLQNVKEFDLLLKAPNTYENDVAQLLSKQDDFVGRKGKFLDHLLARFAENLNDYTFLMIDLFGLSTQQPSLSHKALLLNEYEEIGYNRAKAFDYYGQEKEVWDTYNVSGLQHRIARLLGIADYSRRDVTTYYYEFYPEADDNPVDEWRWRIKHTDGTILFSSSKHYDTMVEAEDELWKTLHFAWNTAYYQLLPTYNNEKWYFNLVDDQDEVIARHIQYYTDKAVAEKTIQDYAAFIQEKITDEGMYMFENILLRPDKEDAQADTKFYPICVEEDCEQCQPEDPYSFRLTFVFPGWTRRFSNLQFREFAEKVIRGEVPAHILTRICWIGDAVEKDEEEEPSQIKQLEALYKAWLTKKMASPDDQTANEHLEPLVDLLHQLDTIYPHGTLHDCNEDGDGQTSIILNRTSLGELKTKQNGSE